MAAPKTNGNVAPSRAQLVIFPNARLRAKQALEQPKATHVRFELSPPLDYEPTGQTWEMITEIAEQIKEEGLYLQDRSIIILDEKSEIAFYTPNATPDRNKRNSCARLLQRVETAFQRGGFRVSVGQKRYAIATDQTEDGSGLAAEPEPVVRVLESLLLGKVVMGGQEDKVLFMHLEQHFL